MKGESILTRWIKGVICSLALRELSTMSVVQRSSWWTWNVSYGGMMLMPAKSIWKGLAREACRQRIRLRSNVDIVLFSWDRILDILDMVSRMDMIFSDHP